MKIKDWFSPVIINKSWSFYRFKTTLRMTNGQGIMGRFGGGWNWKLGIMIGKKTVIFDIIILSIRIDYSQSK